MNENILDFDQLSRIQVAGKDEKITNQDARKIFVAPKSGDYRRTSDFMLANDGKELDNSIYISVEDFKVSLAEALKENTEVKRVVMKKTGKVVDVDKLNNIIELAKKSGYITLQDINKIDSQKAKIVSVKGANMKEDAKVAGMMLGKNGPDMSNGIYVKKDDLEFIPEFTVVKKHKKVSSEYKLPKIGKALASITIAAGLIALLPWIMHANSVAWHHVGPEMQQVLHGINLTLGKLIGANYLGNSSGLWQLSNDTIMNADAVEASLMQAIGTYGLTTVGLAKIVNDIKNGVLKFVKLEKTQKSGAQNIENNDLSGGKQL